MLYFCHVYLNISNCPIVIAVVLYTVLSRTSALIDDLSSCSTVNVAETVKCCCQMKNSSSPMHTLTAESGEMVNVLLIPLSALAELSSSETASKNKIIKYVPNWSNEAFHLTAVYKYYVISLRICFDASCV